MPGPHNLSRTIQALVREARCYPPERESRIVRDVYDCCKNFNGLVPKLEHCVIDSSQTIRLLALDGVIPISYRGVTYQIPVCIWCRPHYPNDAPVPYVRPTHSMVIRERHSHVDKEGRVYLHHYLSIWDPTQFTIYGVVVAMIKVFSIEPPVNSRPTAASPSADSSERRRLIEALTQSISIRLKDITNEALVEACQLDSRKDDLMKNNRFATKYIIAKDRLDRSTQQKNDLEYWVKEVGSRSDNVSIDEVLCYADALDEQIAQCSAEDQSYGDALDQIDEAFVKGVIDHDAYMKHIRDLSRGQFFPRALRKKIEVVRAKKVHQQVDTDPASSRARPNVATLPMYSM